MQVNQMTKRLIALFVLITAAFAQNPSPLSRVAGVYVGANYGQWSLTVNVTNGHTGVGVLGLSSGQASITDGSTIIPIKTNAQLTVGTETVTVTATTCTSSAACTITANFSAIHNPGDKVSSASLGLSEAANAASTQGGGVVVLDNVWAKLGGTTGMITSVTAVTGVVVLDNRGTLQQQYCYTIGLYVSCSGGGGGGSATFTPNAIQYATSTSAARPATSTDVVAIFTGCSGTQYLGADGACHASGTGTVTNTTGPLTLTNCADGNGGSDIQVDANCTLDGSGNMVTTTVQTPGDGVHPGVVSFQGNTTAPTLLTSTFSIIGPSTATPTSWGLQFPGAAPASGLCFKTGTTSAGGVTPVTFAACGGPGGGGLKDLPVAIGQGAGGCSLGGSFPLANAPGCVITAGTSTTVQSAAAQFTASGPYMEWQWTMPATSITSLRLGFYSETDTSNTHNAVWSFQYVCSASGTAAAGTLAAAQLLSITLDGTAGHYLEAALAPTIASCAIGNLIQVRLSLDATTNATGNMDLVSLQVVTP